MTRRSRNYVCLIMILFVAVFFSLPAVHWRLIGCVRGEAFYRGRPTSYWEQEIQRYHCAARTGGPLHFERVYRPGYPNWMYKAADSMGISLSYAIQQPAIIRGLGDSVPVLLELLNSSDIDVRERAAFALGGAPR